MQVLDRTLRDDIAPNLQDWMQAASPDGTPNNNTSIYTCFSMYNSFHIEKQTILKMLKSAEDAQVHEVANQVFSTYSLSMVI